ncbi:MAG TPA: hypothetical protein VEV17_10330 [Bryobacteraceae bacterium]|nr:hypothetical protein [Bryobacteraceae bacterium]
MRLPTVLFFSTVLAAAADLPTARTSPLDLFRELDDCIQQRFLSIGRFGISRILPVHGVQRFRPENAQEREVVGLLEDQGYEVALYLAGRGILDATASTSDSMLGALLSRRGVQGPAFITGLHHPQELPEPAALLPDARTALASFRTAQSYDMQKDGWNVRIRPLRATSPACVACHTHGSGGANEGLKIGDALGAVLYVSRAQ